MSVKQAELGKLWGLSRARISQMVKAGMPLTSVEEAESYRAAHYGGASVRGGQGRVSKSDSVKSGGADFPDRPKPQNASDLKRFDFEGTLARLCQNEVDCWDDLAGARTSGDHNKILVCERHYQSAVDLRVKQEDKVDEILMRRKELVTMSEAKELFGRHLQAARMGLKNMPTRLAPRCNPLDQALAKQVLNEAVAVFFKQLNEWES